MAEDKNKNTNNNLKTDKIKALEKQDVGNKETVSNKESFDGKYFKILTNGNFMTFTFFKFKLFNLFMSIFLLLNFISPLS